MTRCKGRSSFYNYFFLKWLLQIIPFSVVKNYQNAFWAKQDYGIIVVELCRWFCCETCIKLYRRNTGKKCSGFEASLTLMLTVATGKPTKELSLLSEERCPLNLTPPWPLYWNLKELLNSFESTQLNQYISWPLE